MPTTIIYNLKIYISIIGKLEEESLPKRQSKKRMKIEILEQDE